MNPHIESYYSGTLKNSQQRARVKLSLLNTLEIPEDLTSVEGQSFISLVELALQVPSKQTELELKKLSVEHQETYHLIRQYLDPKYINMLTFEEKRECWPTLGEVYEYYVWLFTGQIKSVNLPTEVAKTQVGAYKIEVVPSSLTLISNQDEMQLYIHDKYLKSLGALNKELQHPEFSIDQWDLIVHQFSDPMIYTEVESFLAEGLIFQLSVYSPGVDQDSEIYKKFASDLVAQAKTEIKVIKKKLSIDPIPLELSVIKSASRPQILDALKHPKKITGAQLGAALSKFLPSEWSAVLSQLGGFEHLCPARPLPTLSYIIGLYAQVGSGFWPNLNAHPQIKACRDKILNNLLHFSEIKDAFSPLSRHVYEPLICEFNLIEKLYTIKMTPIELIQDFFGLYSSQSFATLLCSEPMQSLMLKITPWSNSDIEVLLGTADLRLTIDEYDQFMRTRFYRIKILESSRLLRISALIPEPNLKSYLRDYLDVGLFCKMIKHITDLRKLSGLIGPHVLYDLLMNNKEALELIKSFPVSVYVVERLLASIPDQFHDTLLLILRWSIDYPDECILGKGLRLDVDRDMYYNSPYFDIILREYQENPALPIFKNGSEIACAGSFFYAAKRLYFPAFEIFIKLDNLSSCLELEDLYPYEISALGHELGLFSSTWLYHVLASDLLSPHIDTYFKYFGLELCEQLGVHLSFLIDYPGHRQKMIAWWTSQGLNFIRQLVLTNPDFDFTLLFHSKLIQEHLVPLYTKFTEFVNILKILSYKNRWAFIAQCPGLLNVYMKLVKEGKGREIFAILSQGHGRLCDERLVFESTLKCVDFKSHEAEPQALTLHQYRRFCFFNPMSSIDKEDIPEFVRMMETRFKIN